MNTIVDQIKLALKDAGKSLYQVDIPETALQFQATRKEFEGDVTFVVFPLTKLTQSKPEDLAMRLGEFIQEKVHDVIGFNVVKGFLNLVFSDAYWLSNLTGMTKEPHWGFSAPDSKPRMMVEYSSPNTNKPLHLGHLRNNFLGYSVAQILKANGHKVTKVQIINDRGIHICKSMYAWMHSGKNETPESTGMKGDKLVGKYYVEFDAMYKSEIRELMANGFSEDDAKQNAPSMKAAQEMLRAWENGDAEVVALWKKMNGWVYKGFEATYKRMGVDFDQLYFESETYLKGRDEVLKGLEKGVFYRKDDGSVWIDLTEEGLDEKAVLRRDGTAMYVTQDIGTAIIRFEDYPDTASQIYTVGNEQEYHFKVLFKILKKLGWTQSDACYHLSYGMVELPEGKMKSREGTVVDADDLMESMAAESRIVADEQGKLADLNEEEKSEVYNVIGMSALKYFLLRVDPKKNMMFNPQESIDFNGNTGPFVQYGYVRTQAVLRKAGDWKTLDVAGIDLNVYEKSLIQLLFSYPQVLAQAGAEYNPAVVAAFSYELTKTFNSFYQQCGILKEEDATRKSLRLQLTALTGQCIASSMSLLGVSMPSRM